MLTEMEFQSNFILSPQYPIPKLLHFLLLVFPLLFASLFQSLFQSLFPTLFPMTPKKFRFLPDPQKAWFLHPRLSLQKLIYETCSAVSQTPQALMNVA
jgi:hypothetical protein